MPILAFRKVTFVSQSKAAVESVGVAPSMNAREDYEEPLVCEEAAADNRAHHSTVPGCHGGNANLTLDNVCTQVTSFPILAQQDLNEASQIQHERHFHTTFDGCGRVQSGPAPSSLQPRRSDNIDLPIEDSETLGDSMFEHEIFETIPTTIATMRSMPRTWSFEYQMGPSVYESALENTAARTDLAITGLKESNSQWSDHLIYIQSALMIKWQKFENSLPCSARL